MKKLTRKLAIVVSGWHFPLHFFTQMKNLAVPKDWEVSYYVISHRPPEAARKEVESYIATLKNKKDIRQRLDRQLYKKVATVEELQKLGWIYMEMPNTVGDWGNSNQWLDTHDYREYDMFLFSHDDNYIIGDTLLEKVVGDKAFDKWYILSNARNVSPDMYSEKPLPYVRGSFEFFKKEMLDLIGGRFDLSRSHLTREGKIDSPDTTEGLQDWNFTTAPLAEFINNNNLRDKLFFMSPFYRVSPFCIEGERGFISRTHGINTKMEDAGIQEIINQKILNTRNIR